MPKAITDNQGRYLMAVDDLIRENGYSPSTDEIGAKVGVSSKSTVNGTLKRLKARGLVSYLEGQPRTIRVTPGGTLEVIRLARAKGVR